MPSRVSIEKRFKRLTKELETERDNARCAKHVSIALLYRELEDPHLASEWFLKAARHAIWSELGDKAVMYAQMAVLEEPTNAAMRKSYEEIWSKWGSGPAPDPLKDPPKPTQIFP